MFRYFRVRSGWREVTRRTLVEVVDDGCAGLAAQLAFYFFLALFPALLFLVSLIALIPGGAALVNAVDRLQPFLPDDVLSIIRQEIRQVLSGNQAGVMTLAVAGAIWSSSSAMTAIIDALNRAYDLEEWRPFWKRRLLAIALTIALSVFVVSAFALVVGGADLARWVAAAAGAGTPFARGWAMLQWPVAFGLVVLAVDLVYWVAPNTRSPWTWITPGSLLATTLWLLTSMAFRLYVQNVSNYTAVYGAIGGMVVLLLWFYFSGFALLLGAELNSEIEKMSAPNLSGDDEHV